MPTRRTHPGAPGAADTTVRRPHLGMLGVVTVQAYQVLLSPFSGGACRFNPSCSTYAVSAFRQHGLLVGGWLALRRITKCHPFGPHGFDPVPGDPSAPHN